MSMYMGFAALEDDTVEYNFNQSERWLYAGNIDGNKTRFCWCTLPI
jgi:hypothetical protein